MHLATLALAIALAVMPVHASSSDRSVCRYEGMQAACGELLIHTVTGTSGTPRGIIDTVRQAVHARGGTVTSIDSELGVIVATFGANKHLPGLRQELASIFGVRAVSYNLLATFH